ncbi:MAG TPA: pilin [Rhodanobacteraceae bacterium]|nr:pilin [Rhodanobacteraceae bacterium]
MKSMQKGFTLIELMIVVAIIAILAAIAIPAYQNYLIRSQVSEGVTLMDGVKVAATEYFANKGVLPTSNLSAGASQTITGKYVTSVALGTGGVITSTFTSAAPTNSAIYGKTITLSPFTADGVVKWNCKAGTINIKYVPSSCR